MLPDPELFKTLQSRQENLEKSMLKTADSGESRFISLLENTKSKDIKRNFFPLLKQSVSLRDFKEYTKYCEDNEQTLLKKASQEIQNSMNDYIQSNFYGWLLPKDRRNAAEELAKYSKNNKTNWVLLINKINKMLEDSLKADIEAQLSWFKISRNANSRFRNKLMDLKSYIFSICPIETLFDKNNPDSLIFIELESMRDTIFQETKKNYLVEHPELKGLLETLIKTLEGINKNEMNKSFNHIRSALDAVYRHPDYNPEQIALGYLNPHWEYLSTLHARYQSSLSYSDHNIMKEQMIFRKLRIYAQDIPTSAPKTYGFFRDYAIGNCDNHPFAALIKNFSNPRAQYYCKQLIDNMVNHIQNDLNGFNIECSHSDNDSCTISFKVLNLKTHEPLPLKVDMIVDPVNKKMHIKSSERVENTIDLVLK